MKAIVLLMDSLNRRFTPPYFPEAVMPNLERLCSRSAVFDRHWTGSLPCMPARRDIFTGRLEFLERGWGPLEPFDTDFISLLRSNSIYTRMITDHYHYFEPAGVYYCQRFNSWEFVRGQEMDAWAGKAGPSPIVYPGTECYEAVTAQRKTAGKPDMYGVYSRQYELNRERFKKEGFPCERTFKLGCDWLDENHSADNWFLMVEAFDPHEPFDCPDKYMEMFPDDYDGPDFMWSSYRHTEEPADAVRRLRLNYLANLAYADSCLGKLLDKFDEYNLWDDTMIILTADHGHMVGEHGFTGKIVMPVYNEVAHIPLYLHLPGNEYAGARVAEISQNIDLFQTILSHFGAKYNGAIHGGNLLTLLDGKKNRDYALYGVFGENVNLTDGNFTYMRAHATQENTPLYCYTAVPSMNGGRMGNEKLFETIEAGRFLPYTNHPVFKIPRQEVWLNGRYFDYCSVNRLFDLRTDYAQENNLAGGELEKKYEDILVNEMKRCGAPEEQYKRLGLVK